MGHDLPTIFFPVRVNIEPEGRHWFLLVANPRDEVFQVFNSQVIVFTYFLQVILILDVVIWSFGQGNLTASPAGLVILPTTTNLLLRVSQPLEGANHSAGSDRSDGCLQILLLNLLRRME